MVGTGGGGRIRWLGLPLVVALVVPAGVAAALPVYPTPVLTEVGRLVTSPVPGTTTSAGDLEGTAYVPADDAIWLTDDKNRRVYELDRTSGALRSTVTQAQLASTPVLGGTQLAGPDRSLDLEAGAYDQPNDVLYLFSGRCCKDHVIPAVYRLLRDSTGRFVPDAWQPLTSPMDDFSGATTDATGRLWVALGKDIYPYDFDTNTFGTGFRVPGQRGNIRGLGSSPDGADLWIVSGASLLYRVDWATRQIVANHEFDLTQHDVLDGRAVEVIDDLLYIPDGYDAWPDGSSEAYAVRVFELTDGSPSGVAPVGGFTLSTTGGPAPLTVEFTDTSTGEPTGWAWDFGDGTTSTDQHPSHTFTDPGSYTVTLTATNGYGTSQPVTAQVGATDGPTSSIVSLATDDAYVVSTRPDRTNGTNTFVRLGGGATQYRPYVGFTVEDLAGPVTEAVLRLQVTDGSDDGGAWYLVDDAWTQTTLTYGNAPPLTGAPIAEVGRVEAGTWIEVDVTHLVTGDGRYSFAAASNSTNNARFSTAEAGIAPQLVITTTS